MNFFILIVLVLSLLSVQFTFGAPQGDKNEEKNEPMPYDFTYSVKDEPSNSFYGHEENVNDVGRTEGKYFVWLADGRLLTVSYYVDKDSGFVPKLEYSNPEYKPSFT